MKLSVLITLAVLAGGNLARAQSGGGFDLTWSTIDGGGGTSTGGVFSVSGTIGQPDAGVMSSGSFQLTGGFWGVVQTPGAPLLRITRSGGNVILAWPAAATGFRLQQSSVVPAGDGAWSYVATLPVLVGGENRVTLAVTPGHRFFRLRNP